MTLLPNAVRLYIGGGVASIVLILCYTISYRYSSGTSSAPLGPFQQPQTPSPVMVEQIAFPDAASASAITPAVLDFQEGSAPPRSVSAAASMNGAESAANEEESRAEHTDDDGHEKGVERPFSAISDGADGVKRNFWAIYWGGPVSTYQTISDFDKTYHCGPNGIPLVQHADTDDPGVAAASASAKPPECSIRVTFHSKTHSTHTADAILFRAWYAPIMMGKYPIHHRPPHQKWVFMLDEAPYVSGNIQKMMVPPLVHLYNLSMGYHRSSQIAMTFGPTMHRIFDPPLPTAQKYQNTTAMWVSLTSTPLLNLNPDPKGYGAVFSKVAHNCIAFNNRHRYVETLMKYMNVDSYGDCLRTAEWPSFAATSERRRNKDGHGRDHINSRKHGVPPLASGVMENVLKRYKFYLSFENQNCEDYVTEKFFRALYCGSVPVVLGPPNIEDFAPAPHSVIDASQFKGPKELAEYLRYLDQNDTAYEEYLAYKRDPSLVSQQFRWLAEWSQIGSSHRGYSRSIHSLMCGLCHHLQVNGTKETHIKPLLETCNLHNFEDDADCDDQLNPIPADGPLPPSLAALRAFREKMGLPTSIKKMPNSRDFRHLSPRQPC